MSLRPISKATSHPARLPTVVLGATLVVVVGAAVGTITALSHSTTPPLVVGLGILALGTAVWAAAPLLPWLLVVPIVLPGLNVTFLHIPLADLSCAGLLFVAYMSGRRTALSIPGYLTVALCSVVAVALFTFVVDTPPLAGAEKRILHLILFTLLIATVAKGRISPHNLRRGILVGLALGLLSGLAGLAGVSSLDYYAGRLTGWFGDPNVACFITITLGMVAYHHARDRRNGNLTLLLIVVIVALTLSRTGILALGLVFLWIFVIRHVPNYLAIVIVAVVTVAILSLPETIQTLGPYQAHAASDTFRSLVDQLSLQSLKANYVLGAGPGTAFLILPNGNPFFFHNSYYAGLSEFGLLGGAAYLALLIPTAFKLLQIRPRSYALESALLSVVIFALTIGEILFTLTAAIALGSAWYYILSSRTVAQDDLNTPVQAAL
jgi:O-Antigen ligase